MCAKDGAFVVFRTFDDILDFDHFANDLIPAYLHESHSHGEGRPASHTICMVALTAQDFFAQLSPNQRLNPVSHELLLHFPGIPNVVRAGVEDSFTKYHQSLPFHQPNRNFIPKILQPRVLSSNIWQYVVFEQNHSVPKRLSWRNVEEKNFEKFQYIRPKQRCVVIIDAHVASCLKTEFSRSCTYLGKFLDNMGHVGGFKDCSLVHELSTSPLETKNLDHCIPIGVLLEFFIVWPWQKIDHAWSVHVLGLLNKHVVLEEGLAWLSTLGGAHSSLGEKFLYHAERAGEISGHQMRLAKELGNEMMIARCYLYWSWSLLQRRFLRKCQNCVISTWRYCHQLRCRDTVLENMCKAVWTRLKYEKSLRRGHKLGPPQRNGTNHSFDRKDVLVCVG